MAIMARTSSSRKSSSRKKGSGSGCLIWLILLLATLLLFVLNWDRIQETLKTTRFGDAISGTDRGSDDAPPPAQDLPPIPDDQGQETITIEPDGQEPDAELVQPEPQDQSPPADDTPSVPDTPQASPVDLVKGTSVVALYFVRVDEDGTVTRQEVKRTVEANNTPLTSALNALIQGPTADDLSRNLISMIPDGTRLLSAQVVGSTAYLNFNEAFMINRYGAEGYAAQLKQIVYTATSFPTVKDVQFLIEGNKREYLGGEGVYIGKPLSRASF